MQDVNIPQSPGGTVRCPRPPKSGLIRAGFDLAAVPASQASSRRASSRHPELSHEIIEYETPPDFFAVLDRQFRFTLDVCAAAANAKCRRFFSVQENGLRQRWLDASGEPAVCWMNPPYGDDELTRWMAKARAEALEGSTVVCLVPARTHAQWFHTLCARAEVRFLRGRLRYVGTPGEAPFAQLVVIFRARLARPWGMKRWDWRPRTKQKLLALS